MASSVCVAMSASFSYSLSRSLRNTEQKPRLHFRRAAASPRAESINPAIRKEEAKVVDTVVVPELAKPLTAFCRCWRSGTFPLCDGTHVKHNKATGDNVGPLLVKKE